MAIMNCYPICKITIFAIDRGITYPHDVSTKGPLYVNEIRCLRCPGYVASHHALSNTLDPVYLLPISTFRQYTTKAM